MFDDMTLSEALWRSADRGVGELVFHLKGEIVRLPVRDLAGRAVAGARRLVAAGVQPGDRVGLLGPNHPEWATWAFSVWVAGAVLVPLQVPLRVRDMASLAARVAGLVQAARCRVVVAEPSLASAVPEGMCLPWQELEPESGELGTTVNVNDPAVIQFTSGSTAAPKGAVLTHPAVLAQMRLLSLQSADPSKERIVGWVPFFHDLGLFLYLVFPVVVGAQSHLLPTERFAQRPAEWLALLTATGATATVAPASAFDAAIRAAARLRQAIDLSTLRLAWFAAEGVDPEVVNRVLASAVQWGAPPEALGSTYGLAEAVLSVTCTGRDHPLRVEEVDLSELTGSGRAVSAVSGPTRRLVSCGRPVGETKVRIVGPGGELPERHVGEVLVRSPSVMSGYFGDQAPDPFVDGWLRTGDLGYVADGELYITGRAKDMVIVMGNNYYPEDFEWAAGRVPGVRPGQCVAFRRPATEGVVLVVERAPGAEADGLPLRVRHAVTDAVGAAPAEVLVVPRGTIERTTSGKLRRGAMRDAYARGELQTTAVIGK